MTVPNPQAGPLTGLDVGADGAGLPYPAPRLPRIVDEAHGALMAWAGRDLGPNPHWGAGLSASTCQLGEGALNAYISEDASDCWGCIFGAVAEAVRKPHSQWEWISLYEGRRPAWRLAQALAGYARDEGHPAAVHMQRIATELELRYGLGIEVTT